MSALWYELLLPLFDVSTYEDESEFPFETEPPEPTTLPPVDASEDVCVIMIAARSGSIYISSYSAVGSGQGQVY